jgi:hypothetical protein
MVLNMTLLFENRFGQERPIAEVNTKQEASKEIQKFLDGYNYKSYYTRYWVESGCITYDVGSHSEFFKIRFNSDEEAKAFLS